MVMRVFVLSLVVVLGLPGMLFAGEKLYLSRTLNLDFRHPGKILVVATEGTVPVGEEVAKNSYALILPKRVKLILSIAQDNERKRHYHIVVTIQDELRPVDKATDVIRPGNLVTQLWLASYRYQFTILRKHAVGGNRFVTAVVKLDVFAPGPK